MSKLAAGWLRVRETRLCGPMLMFLSASWLLYHLLTADYYSFSTTRTAYGPLSWAEFSLLMLIGCAGCVCAARGWRCIARARSPGEGERPAPSGAEEFEGCDNYRAAVGGWLILLYGLGIVFVGFLFATVAFLVIWLLFDGMRNPFKLAAIGVLGTLAPMYLLVKVAYLPLPRGVGIFDTWTLHLYELLRLF